MSFCQITIEKRQLCETIEEVFAGEAKAVTGQAGFYIRMELASSFSLEELTARAEKAGISLIPVREEGAMKNFLLSCSCVPADRYEPALLRLKKVWET